MDALRFDGLVRSLETVTTRKQAVRLLGGIFAGSLAGLAGQGGADGRRRRRDAEAGSSARTASFAAGDDGGGSTDGGPGEELPDGSPVARRNQQSFVNSCRANGGTSSRVSTYVAKCCYAAVPGKAGAWCDTCNFNYDPPACHQTYLHPKGGIEVAPRPGDNHADLP